MRIDDELVKGGPQKHTKRIANQLEGDNDRKAAELVRYTQNEFKIEYKQQKTVIFSWAFTKCLRSEILIILSQTSQY